MIIKKFIKRISFRILYPVSKYYLSKERTYKYKDIAIKVMPDVFHPGLFFSTKILLEYLNDKKLNGSSLLELGAGTGLISVLCAKKGALVTATDISSKAIQNIKHNAADNSVRINVILSDLFDDFPEQKFDWIIINPPYFPKDPSNDYEQAWYCGSNFQFFTKFFNQLDLYSDRSSNIIMILSEDCDIKTISDIAEKNSFRFNELKRKRKWGEWNFLYRIERKSNLIKTDSSEDNNNSHAYTDNNKSHNY
jgi:release factor glutamine methyltransferase